MISIAMYCDSANASCLLNTATLGLIHLVPNCHPGQQRTHRDKTKKEPTSFKMVIVVFACLLPNAFLALWQFGSFVARERLAAKGLIF